MIEAYTSLPAWLRTIAALIVLGIGLVMTFAGYGGRAQTHEVTANDGRVMLVQEGGERGDRAAFRLGIITTGVGCIMVMLSGKSRAEKEGYNF